jgi:hypothetical protein
MSDFLFRKTLLAPKAFKTAQLFSDLQSDTVMNVYFCTPPCIDGLDGNGVDFAATAP